VLSHEKPVTAVAMYPSGRLVATGSGDGTIRIRETPGGKARTTFHTPNKGFGENVFTALAFSKDGSHLLAVRDGLVMRWKTTSVFTPEEADKVPLPKAMK